MSCALAIATGNMILEVLWNSMRAMISFIRSIQYMARLKIRGHHRKYTVVIAASFPITKHLILAYSNFYRCRCINIP